MYIHTYMGNYIILTLHFLQRPPLNNGWLATTAMLPHDMQISMVTMGEYLMQQCNISHQ